MAEPEATPFEFDQEFLSKEFNKAYARVTEVIKGNATLAEASGISSKDLEALYRQGVNALQVEDFTGAELMFSSLLLANNKDVRAAMGLAGAMEGQGRYTFAVPFYFLVLAITPYDPVAPFRAGMCMMNLGKTEEARKFFDLAAQCRGEIKDPAKTVYVEKAEGMLRAMSTE